MESVAGQLVVLSSSILKRAGVPNADGFLLDDPARPHVVFVGNFDFELTLSHPQAQRSQSRLSLVDQRTWVWLTIAQPGDVIYMPGRDASASIAPTDWPAHLPHVPVIADLNAAPLEAALSPWGWSAGLLQAHYSRPVRLTAPVSADAVRLVNSRNWSHGWETALRCVVPGACRVDTLDAWGAAITQLVNRRTQGDRPWCWITKANLGMSGREQRRGKTHPNDIDLAWARRRLARDGCLFVEPFLDGVLEFSLHYDVPGDGLVQEWGLVPLESTPHGAYAGSWLAHSATPANWINHLRPDLPPQAFQHLLEQANQTVRQVINQAAELGYRGPIGVDGMLYRTAEGSLACRPIQDLNARWTMGRLALGCRRWLAPGEVALWDHSRPGTSSQVNGSLLPPPDRQLSTAPSTSDQSSPTPQLLIWSVPPNRAQSITRESLTGN